MRLIRPASATVALFLAAAGLLPAQSAPNPPSNFSSSSSSFTHNAVTGTDDTSITWNWTAANPQPGFYLVRDDATLQVVGATPGGTNTFQEKPAAPGTYTRHAVSVNSTLNPGAGADGVFDSATYVSGAVSGVTKTGISAFTITVDTANAGHPGGVYSFISFRLRSGDTLKAVGANALEIRCLGDVNIEGTIALGGSPGSDGKNDGSSAPGGGAVCA
ncbi:MAG: hypothetical protein HY719_03905, partial [Planctomycetes bacterium]|nr:hypothetical protein [Planctomycetota bacterium]